VLLGLLVCGEFGEEVSDATLGVVGAEFGASTVGLSKPADEHPHDLQGGTPMFGNEGPEFRGGERLGRQRFEGYRTGQARRGVEGGELSDEFAGAANAEERLVTIGGGGDDLDAAFEDREDEVTGIAVAKHAGVAPVSASVPVG
jgi:hypothetical protein